MKRKLTPNEREFPRVFLKGYKEEDEKDTNN